METEKDLSTMAHVVSLNLKVLTHHVVESYTGTCSFVYCCYYYYNNLVIIILFYF